MEEKIIAELDKKLDLNRVKTKKVGDRPEVSYLESYDVIDTANRIFGYGNWGTVVKSVEIKEAGGKTACVATVQLQVEGCLPREDVGVVIAAAPRDKLTPEALETAAKGAVSDGTKRCFRHFGNQFGNSLYSKDKPAQRQAAHSSAGQIKGAPDIKEREAAPDAGMLTVWIHNRVKEKAWDDPATENQLGLLNGLLTSIFGEDEMAERQRHQFLDFIFGTLTSKSLTKGQASALIDWAKDSVGKAPHPVAVVEAQMVVRACEVEAGQEEMPF